MLRARWKCLLILSLSPFAAAAEEESKSTSFEISAEASAGFVADSNVSVSELDQNTGAGDIAAIFGAKFDAVSKPSDRWVLRGGYEFSQTAYQDFGDFNLQTHRGSAEAEYDLRIVNVGVLYNFVHARLGGDGFLNYQQIAPYISRMFAKRVFLRGSYGYTDKNFLTADARDAISHAGQIDAFIFLDGLKRYLVLGGDIGGENAVDDQFDLDSYGLKARLIQRFALFDREAKLRTGLDYDRKDYTSITTSIGEERDDKIFSADARLEVPLFGPAAMNIGYEYRDRSSDLPAADFDEHLGEVKLVINY